jgi:hypothetical protein
MFVALNYFYLVSYLSDHVNQTYRILSSMVQTFFEENYDEILPLHYTWKVPEKGFKINWVMH